MRSLMRCELALVFTESKMVVAEQLRLSPLMPVSLEISCYRRIFHNYYQSATPYVLVHPAQRNYSHYAE